MRGEHTPGPWKVRGSIGGGDCIYGPGGYGIGKAWNVNGDPQNRANARLIAAAPTMADALNYVADNTYCGADAKWHFKPGYDPQVVLDAISRALGQGGEK